MLGCSVGAVADADHAALDGPCHAEAARRTDARLVAARATFASTRRLGHGPTGRVRLLDRQGDLGGLDQDGDGAALSEAMSALLSLCSVDGLVLVGWDVATVFASKRHPDQAALSVAHRMSAAVDALVGVGRAGHVGA